MRVYVANLKPLRPGKIHIRCATCGRKRSNQKRPPEAPVAAILMEIECPRHDYDPTVWYFDENGDEVKV